MGSDFNIGILKFHAYDFPYSDEEIEQYGKDKNDLSAKSIWWKGNEYKAWTYQITGIESSTDGTVATQRLKVSNIENSITPLFYKTSRYHVTKIYLLVSLTRLLSGWVGLQKQEKIRLR